MVFFKASNRDHYRLHLEQLHPMLYNLVCVNMCMRGKKIWPLISVDLLPEEASSYEFLFF